MCPCLIPSVGARPHPEGQRVGLQPPVEGPTTRLGLRGPGGPGSCGSPPSRGARPGPCGLCVVARSPARPDRAVAVSLVLGACQSLERFPPRFPRSSLVALPCVCPPPCSHVCARGLEWGRRRDCGVWRLGSWCLRRGSVQVQMAAVPSWAGRGWPRSRARACLLISHLQSNGLPFQPPSSSLQPGV